MGGWGVTGLRPIRTDANNVEVSWPTVPRRRFGVPIGGPFDALRFRRALALFGLDAGAGLEIGFFGGEWEAEADLIVGYSGAPREGFEEGLRAVAKGERLAIGMAMKGHRGYLAWRSGKDAPKVRLAELALSESPIRFIPNGSWAVAERELRVSPNINRIGLRLDPMPDLRHDIELPSEPQCVGAIQITPDGTPIIIGPDGPTIGGYPKAGVVISADIGRLAQLRPGDVLHLEPVTLEAAREAAAEQERAFAHQLAQLKLAMRIASH